MAEWKGYRIEEDPSVAWNLAKEKSNIMDKPYHFIAALRYKFNQLSPDVCIIVDEAGRWRHHEAFVKEAFLYDNRLYAWMGMRDGWVEVDPDLVYGLNGMYVIKPRSGGKTMEYNKIKFGHLAIKKVIFNDPATIVFWEDNSKTVVTCSENESFDPEKGLAMAIAKKAFGNQGNYYNQIKKWLPETEKEESTCDITWSIREAINNVFGDPKRVKAAKKLTEIQELICDMTFRGATKAELTRAIRFSKDLIDASKGADIDITKSVAELGIAELEEKYQHKEL